MESNEECLENLKVIILTSRPQLEEESSIDLDNGCIVISPTDRFLEYAWVKIRLNGANQSTRLVQVLFNDLIEDSNVVYLPPLLWHNLFFQPLDSAEDVFWQFPLEQPKASISILYDKKPSNQIEKTATKFVTENVIQSVQVNFIQCPDYPLEYDYSNLLKCYFNSGKQRCFRLNDVLGVPASEDPLFMFHNTLHTNTVILPAVVYFQISQINGSTNKQEYYFNKSGEKIKIFKVSNVNRCVPSMLKMYHQPSISDQCLLKTIYSSCVEDLVCQFRPYLLRSKMLKTGTFLFKHFGDCKTSREVVNAAAQNWHLNVFEVAAIDLLCEVPQTTEAKIRHVFARLLLYAPCVMLITDLDILFKSDIFETNRIIGLLRLLIGNLSSPHQVWPVMIVATVDNSDSHPLAELFLHKLSLKFPNDQARETILRSFICRIFPNADIPDLSKLIKLTSGFNADILITLINETVKQNMLDGNKCLLDNFLVQLQKSIEKYCESNSESTGGLLQVPNVTWSDIGGLEEVKKDILETIELPLKLGLSFKSLGLRRSGILLYGPPGTGKTLLAKAVAAQCSLNFISVKGPELINKYVGQSEENVRNLFAQARRASPSIIFFDELDSLAPARGRSGDSGGVMDRVVSQLMTELDGISSTATSTEEKESMVFVIGATNRIDLIDSALLRPGRFDKAIEVPVASDTESRRAILTALMRKFVFEDSVDRKSIVEQVEAASLPGMSGADFYSLCSNAMFNALKRTIDTVESSGLSFGGDDSDSEDKIENDELFQIKVRLSDFEVARK